MNNLVNNSIKNSNADSPDNNPVVSVLMCVYNDERYVSPAIESILNQTFLDFEFIIVDDGSTDSTPEILNKYAERDKRIKVFRIKNSGTTVAANFGLQKARGKYVARLDSDDISYPDRLQIEVDYLNTHPNVALIGGGSDLIDMNGNVVGQRNINTKNSLKTLHHRCIFQQSDVMFRRNLVIELGGYREKFHNSQDYDLWLRISEKAGIAKLATPLGQWRLNNGGYTFSRRDEQLSDTNIVKRMAKQRRKTGKDNYDIYEPSELKKHRVNITDADYEMILAAANLLALRKIEARERITKIINENGMNVKLLIAKISTYLPSPLLKLIFGVREFYKNNF